MIAPYRLTLVDKIPLWFTMEVGCLMCLLTSSLDSRCVSLNIFRWYLRNLEPNVGDCLPMI